MTFRPGQSGNPGGRPANGGAITPTLRRLLADKRDGKARAEHVAEAWISAAEAGDLVAIKSLVDRVDGKVPEAVDLTSGGQTFAFTLDIGNRRTETDADRDD